MERKVTKIGNSLGVTMTEAFKKLGIDFGDMVHIEVHEDDGEIVIKKSQPLTLPDGLSPDFLDTLQTVMRDYDETLKGLKDR
jgi:antitoxin MazE